MRDIVRQVLNVVATLAVIAINALASASGLNGQTTGEISDRFSVFFVPAGYVFSIWGLIYLGLLGFTVYQALPAQRENPRLRRGSYLYVLGSAANIAWLLLWHYEYFEWSMAAMGALLISLIALYLALGVNRVKVTPVEKLLVQIPFSLYLGWITVATIANATVVLTAAGWNAFGLAPQWWAVIMLFVAAIITTAVSLTRGDVIYVLVIAWAFAGIAVKHQATTSVEAMAIAMAAWVVLTLAVGVPLNQHRLQPRTEAVETSFRDQW